MNYLLSIFTIGFCLLLFVTPVLAQKEHLKITLIDNTDPTRWIEESPEQKPGKRGDQYLFDGWLTSMVELQDGWLPDSIFLNYNLEENLLELATKEGLRQVPDGLIKRFRFSSPQPGLFMHVKDPLVSVCDLPDRGYVEYLSVGAPLGLCVLPELEIRQPTYHRQLGVGDPNIKYQKKETIWIIHGQDCMPLEGSQRNRITSIQQFLRQSSIRDLVKEANWNLKQVDDVVLLLKKLTKT